MNLRRTSAALAFAATVATFAATAATQTAGAARTPVAPSAAASAPGRFVAGEVLTQFRPTISAADKAAVVRGVGATNAGTIRDLDVDVLRVPDGAEQRVIDALLRSGKVTFAERDGVGQTTAVPNDPYWPQEWGPAKINTPTAWNSTTGSSSVVVAVLDTGVNFAHPDLQGRFVPGYDFINNDTDPTDDQGHGTGTAGIVGAATNNGVGVAGMCWTCSIMPIKVATSTGSAPWSAVSSGITWATDHGAKVISMSLSGTGGSTTLQNAVAYAESHDVVVVSAAGNNSNSTLTYPASYPGVISVAGTQSNDTLYSWSTYGSWVSVAAPGCDSTTTLSGGYTSSFCGTSAATPVVAGLAGLARSFAPSASAAQIGSAIESSAVNVGSIVAYGRVDASATLAALGGTGPTSSPTPTASPSPTVSPSPSATSTTTTSTFSGSLTPKVSSRSFSLPSGAGAMQLQLTFSRVASLSLTVRDSSGQSIWQGSGASPLPASLTVTSDTYTLTISGNSKASFTVTATVPNP